MKVISYACRIGNFSTVTADVTLAECETATVLPNYTSTELSVFVEIHRIEGNCPKEGGLSEYGIIGIAVAAAVLVLVSIIVAILCGVKSIRRRAFPHRDRESFRPSTST